MNQAMQQELVEAIDHVAKLAGIYAPQFAGYIVLGSMLAKMAPEVYGEAVALLGLQAPSAEQKLALARKVQALAQPETL